MAQIITVIAPHPDDESIGCGGMICLHRQRGEAVRVAFLTSGERGIAGMSVHDARTVREGEAAKALEALGVERADFLRLPDLDVAANLLPGAERLAKIFNRDPPNVIYLPHPNEAHPDHEAALPLLRAALRRASHNHPLPELRAYEVWTPMQSYDWPEDISPVFRIKLRAVRCYRSQLQTFRYDRAVRGLNQYRGCLAARSRYAEVFRYLDPQSEAKGYSKQPAIEVTS